MCAICLCTDRFRLGWAHDAFSFAHHTFMHFPCIHTSFQYTWYIWNCLELFWLSFLSLPLFLFTLDVSMAPKRKSTPARNPLHSKCLFIFWFCPSLSLRFRDDDTHKAFSENFSRRGIHSKRQVVLSDFADTDLPSVIHNRGRESLCDVPVTCPLVLIQEFYSNMHKIDRSVPFFFIHVWGTRIPVTPQLVADVLHVPRIEFPAYPSCERLRTMSKDELMSSFCECPTAWGERLFTPCWPFAKSSRFMNMVMTFVLHPLSHYNMVDLILLFFVGTIYIVTT